MSIVQLDMRAQFAELLNDYGFWVLLQRNSKRIHCTCWNEKYQEGLSTHTPCGGTGWITRIERIQTRRKEAAITVTRPDLTQEASIGRVVTNEFYWYARWDTFPRAGDLLYEVNWDNTNAIRPVSLVKVHSINAVDEYRGDNGMVIYNTIATRQTTSNLKVENLIIRSIGNMMNYGIGG